MKIDGQTFRTTEQTGSLEEIASDVAFRADAAMSQVVDTMESINETLQKISCIVGAFNGIAFQANSGIQGIAESAKLMAWAQQAGDTSAILQKIAKNIYLVNDIINDIATTSAKMS
jgi:methyl-accepting chemotaxis protein